MDRSLVTTPVIDSRVPRRLSDGDRRWQFQDRELSVIRRTWRLVLTMMRIMERLE